MEKVTIDELAIPTPNPAEKAVPLSGVLGTTDLAINYYELAAGERFGFDLHRHMDQEEIFYIQAGTVTFQLEEGEVEVNDGEVIRFAPGEFQLGENQSEQVVKAVALGAPRDTREIEYLRQCQHCEEETIQRLAPPEKGEFLVTCTQCKRETVSERV